MGTVEFTRVVIRDSTSTSKTQNKIFFFLKMTETIHDEFQDVKIPLTSLPFRKRFFVQHGTNLNKKAGYPSMVQKGNGMTKIVPSVIRHTSEPSHVFSYIRN